MSEEWTPVLSKNQLKAAKAAQKAFERRMFEKAKKTEAIIKAVEKFMVALSKNTTTIDYTSLVDKRGYPRPVEMEWPTLKHEEDSPLLSETCGSTKGSHFAYYLEELDKYTLFIKFLSSYTVPIYDIRIKEHTDMGYVPGYKGRRPYTESITVKILTFAGKDLPVVHEYNMDVYRIPPENVKCIYTRSYSPSFSVSEYYDASEFEGECWMRLANLTSH